MSLRIRGLPAEPFSELFGLSDQLEGAIERLFADPRTVYLHIHFAAPGCYAALVERAG